jgi:hypothetical protein
VSGDGSVPDPRRPLGDRDRVADSCAAEPALRPATGHRPARRDGRPVARHGPLHPHGPAQDPRRRAAVGTGRAQRRRPRRSPTTGGLPPWRPHADLDRTAAAQLTSGTTGSTSMALGRHDWDAPRRGPRAPLGRCGPGRRTARGAAGLLEHRRACTVPRAEDPPEPPHHRRRRAHRRGAARLGARAARGAACVG